VKPRQKPETPHNLCLSGGVRAYAAEQPSGGTGMSKIRRVAAMVAAAAAAVGLATATTATPAAASRRGPHPARTWLMPVKSHQGTWVSVYWMTGRSICGAELTVASDDVGVGYPANTATYTSFSKDDSLSRGHVDYTSFKVWPTLDWSAYVPLEATLSYHTCGPQAVDKRKTFWLTLPVVSD
jgi:hypothetical protein